MNTVVRLFLIFTVLWMTSFTALACKGDGTGGVNPNNVQSFNCPEHAETDAYGNCP
jgi:hypothetical protein